MRVYAEVKCSKCGESKDLTIQYPYLMECESCGNLEFLNMRVMGIWTTIRNDKRFRK